MDSFDGNQNHLNGSSSHVQDAKLLVYSANTQESLRRLMEQYHEYNQNHPEMLSDVAYTLALRREHLTYRAYAISGHEASHVVSPSVRVPGTTPEAVMIFSGQGAQWAKMGSDLCLEDLGFRRDIEDLSLVLQRLRHPPDWELKGNGSSSHGEQ